jgi:hypothetical protein
MTDTPATPKIASDTLAQAVYQEFKDRPIVIAAVLKQFSMALNNRYPELHIDVLTTTLNTPNWVSEKVIVLQEDGENTRPVERQDIRVDGYTTTPLFEVMIHSITAKAQLYYTREHFLSDAQNKRMAVEMREVEDLLRRLPKVMVAALQQALTDYWNEPAVEGTSRWQWLSDVLRTALLVSMAPSGSGSFLDQEQSDTLLQVIYCATKSQRIAQYGEDCAQAFLIDYHARSGRTSRATLSYEVLVTRKINGRDLVVSFHPDGAIEAYDSMQAFADAKADKSSRTLEFTALELQPYESIGDVFVTQAQALLNNQLESLGAIGPFAGQDLKALEDRYARLTDLTPYLRKLNPGSYEQRIYGEVSTHLPEWTTLANAAQTQEYSRYMFRLAVLQQATKGQAYNDGLSTAKEFARTALEEGMFAYGEVVDPDLIEVTQYRNEDGLLVILGPGLGRLTAEADSLTHRALSNLAGLPFLASEFKHKNGLPVPAWMTLDAFRELISNADIGKNYPAHIKRLLLDDPVQRAKRENLFTHQLRIQLPMLALENMIRERSGFTDAGYRCVAAIMDREPQARRVAGQDMVIRHLAFKTNVSNQVQVVSNMFVFGPVDVTVGPHILYRPLYLEQLIEFASLGALMAEIVSDNPRPTSELPPGRQPDPSLQKSVLDWLAPDDRKIYDNGGFLEPHPVGVILDEDLLPSTPAELDKQVLGGDPLTQLYEANARVLADLADEQTLSNAEYRWNTLKEMGLIIFNSVLNAVLPFVSGPAAAVGWLFVLETAVLQALQSLADGDSEPLQDLSFNVLINLAMALLVHRLAPGFGAPIKPFAPHAVVSKPSAVEVTAQLKPPIGPGAASALTDTALDFSTPISGNSRLLLERFISTRQVGVGPVITAPVPKGIEVVDGRWYAKVPGRLSGHGWVRVSPAQGENVVVLDLGMSVNGLELKNNGQGLWDIAPEFRVRGGGPGTSRYLSDVFADPELRARRADCSIKVRRLKDRISELGTDRRQAGEHAREAYEKARLVAGDITRNAVPHELPVGPERSRLEKKLEALKLNLRKADIEYKKKGRLFIDGYLNQIKLLEEIATLVEKDKHYNRDEMLINLQKIVSGYAVIDDELLGLSGIWSELGTSQKEIFPLDFELRTVNTDVPYSALLDIRKRILSGYSERIKVSARYEQTMAELVALDESTKKGLLQRAGYLSETTLLLKNNFERRTKTTAWLIATELLSLRGVLAGDSALEPSLVEVAALEGLGKAKLGEVTTNVLKLDSTQGFEPRQRIDLLQEAIDVYNDSEVMAGYLRKTDNRQSYVPQVFLQKFLDALKRLRDMAETELSESIREDVQDESAPVETEQPEGETPKKTRKRIKRPNERLIKTAQGYRMGDAQEITADEPDETVVVKNLETGEDIIYYRHENEDLYQQRVVEQPEKPPVPRTIAGLRTLINTGEKLVDGVTKLISNYKKDAYLYREPASLENRFLIQARKLDAMAADIEQKIQGVTGADWGAAVKVLQGLRTASANLVKVGKQLRVNLTKALPPNAGSFEYLLGEHEVHVGNSSWTDKSTPTQVEFLLEYEVLDSTARGADKILWYAHFHCSAKSVLRVSEAHLKLKRLRYMTVKDQLKNPEIGPGKVVYPGTMKTDFSTRYFFDAHPPKP